MYFFSQTFDIDISIHAPHTGRDGVVLLSGRRCSKFQSTRPIRGATLCLFRRLTLFRDFNPRAPYGARRTKILLTTLQTLFQSTRPIRGATIFQNSHSGSTTLFQSTRPIRGATLCRLAPNHHVDISIHAPHTGRDGYKRLVTYILDTISIHAPHTGRDCGQLCTPACPLRFQSTRPIRGATAISGS